LYIILHSACRNETWKGFAVRTETQHDDDKKKTITMWYVVRGTGIWSVMNVPCKQLCEIG